MTLFIFLEEILDSCTLQNYVIFLTGVTLFCGGISEDILH